jgi:PAS domain S-box-containing protein
VGRPDNQDILHRSLLGEAIDGLEDVAVFVWDDAGHYVAVNEHACRLTGLTREELVGMPVGELSPDGAAVEMHRVQRAPLARGASSFTRPDGERVDLEWVTIHTSIARLPLMVSICWRAGAAT